MEKLSSVRLGQRDGKVNVIQITLLGLKSVRNAALYSITFIDGCLYILLL